MTTASEILTGLPPLSGWEKTGHSLHRAAQLLGAIRLLSFKRVPNYLELALVIGPDGLSTGRLPSGAEVILNFQTAALVYQPPSGEPASLSLIGQSQASLVEIFLEIMGVHGETFAPPKGDRASHTDTFLEALTAIGHPYILRREDLASEVPLEVEPALSSDYSQALYRVFTAAARFRARLNGQMTPVVVWPEHFDLSFLWFPGTVANEDAPQMNFGFAPFSDGFPRPYLYAYAYPMPDGFQQLKLPRLARWHTEGWQGMVVAYDDLVQEKAPEKAIEEIFEEVYLGLCALW